MFSKRRLIIHILLAAILSTQRYHAFADNTSSVRLASGQSIPAKRVIHNALPAPPFGLAWGESYNKVKQALTDKGFNYTSPAGSSKTTTLFSTLNPDNTPGIGISIDGEMTEMVAITMGSKGLACVMYLFAPEPDDKDTLAQFHRVAKKLAMLYGPPGQAVDEVHAPYKRGDEVEAVQNNKGKVSDSWYFAPSTTGADSGMVATHIAAQLEVAVLYYNQTLAN